jgi:hypothetical protein
MKWKQFQENLLLKKLAWWHMPVMTALKKLRQEDNGFKVSLGYIVSLRSAWIT